MNAELTTPASTRTRARTRGRRSEHRRGAAALRRLWILFVLLQLTGAPARAVDDSEGGGDEAPVAKLEIDEALLESLSAEVLPAVSEHTGVSLDGLTMRVARRSELREVLQAELEPQFAAMFEDPEMAADQLEQTARIYSMSLLAKYAFRTDEVLVSESNFNALAAAIERPGLATEDALRVVLVHEAVHAVDERRYGTFETLGSLGSRDEIMAFSAVMEGHAQHVARRIAAAEGWSGAFELFTDSIDESPDTGEVAVDYVVDLQVAVMASAYYDGENFIAHLAEHGGPDAIARAFREPPAETILIEEPGWYLDPDSRPALVHDFEPVLETFSEERDAEGDWNTQLLELTGPMIDTAFSLLPEEEVEPVVETIRQNHMLLQVAADAPVGTVMIAAGLFEAESPDAARELLELEVRLMHEKDEVMGDGPVKIEDPRYRDVARGPITGMLGSKTLKAGGQELFASTVVLRRDLVVLEANFVGERWSEEEVFELSVGLLDAAHRSRHALEDQDAAADDDADDADDADDE